MACLNITDVLSSFGVRHINYLSVDTEGSELSVLKTFPFDRVTTDVIGVEVLKKTRSTSAAHNAQCLAKEQKLITFMERVNYKLFRDFNFAPDTSDLFFVPNNASKAPTDGIVYDDVVFEHTRALCKKMQRRL